ncbi:MAG: hypothetical protein BRC48_14545 [Cyanobacteria bacterium QS_9_48_30]|nr:MAG: hypothetical protein BRC48_14545 [Cyanobacteria bacterium QS_9_48_30]
MRKGKRLLALEGATLTAALITGTSVAQAASFDFSETYDTRVTIDPSFRPDNQNLFRVTVTGESADAPFGLTNFVSDTYGQFNPNTNTATFDANPAAIGIEGEPILSDRYFGGRNELFGRASDMAKFNFEQGTVMGAGTIALTGGEGVFENATGTIDFTQNDTLPGSELPQSFEGEARLDYQVQTPQPVPEPGTNAMLVASAGIIGFGFLKRSRRRKST